LNPSRAAAELDGRFAGLRERIFVREVDRSLIVLPNRVFGLNDAAYRVLGHLQRGGRFEVVLRAAPNPKQAAADLADLLQGLESLVQGDGEDVSRQTVSRPGLEFFEYRKTFFTYPVLSEFALTRRCNLRCRFCYLDGGCVQEMSTRRARSIIDKIRDEAQVPFLSFTGGEPLLRKDLEPLIAHAKARGLRVNLISNGSLLDAERVRRLVRAGLDSAQISLESWDAAVHNRLTGVESFDDTVTGIGHLLEAGIYVHINTTLNRENIDRLERFPHFVASLGVRKFSANLLIPVGRARRSPELWLSYRETGPLIERLRSAAADAGVTFVWYSPLPYCLYNPMQKGLGATSCAACHGLLSIDPAGRILPCSCHPQEVGSWLTHDFKTLWFSRTALHFRGLQYLEAACTACDQRELCAGACPLYWEAVGTDEISG